LIFPPFVDGSRGRITVLTSLNKAN
jgi:hypothetical protein